MRVNGSAATAAAVKTDEVAGTGLAADVAAAGTDAGTPTIAGAGMTLVEPDAIPGVDRDVVEFEVGVSLPGEGIGLGSSGFVGRGVDPGAATLPGGGTAGRLPSGVGIGAGVVGMVAGGEALRLRVND